MKRGFAALSLLASGVVGAYPPEYSALFEEFKRDFDKSYDQNGEEDSRFAIFKANVDIMFASNAQNLSYYLGINQFADLTVEEYAKTYLGYKSELRATQEPRSMSNISTQGLPASVDWVAKGAVTPVKNQQSCGSCWAFSTTGSLEGAYFKATGKLLSLSEENLVQCDHNGDQGCQGGMMDNAFDWIQKNGIDSEAEYPYTSGGGSTGKCTKKGAPVVTLTGHKDVPTGDEEALKAAVAQQPVSIAIEADKSAFQMYSGGILDNAGCGTQLDHGVLLVGYGTDNGKDYWKVKNSWGAMWGEEGYIRMVRGKNQCGLATQPCYPTGAKAMGPGPAPGPSPGPAPGPSPPPAPPAGKTHYGDPKNGCEADEMAVRIQGVQGGACVPKCNAKEADAKKCPHDVPKGVTAKPACDLQDQSHKQYCSLKCTPSKNGNECGPNASCKSIGSIGICTYDDDKGFKADAETTIVAPEHEEIVV